jgi:hypothetical protein
MALLGSISITHAFGTSVCLSLALLQAWMHFYRPCATNHELITQYLNVVL